MQTETDGRTGESTVYSYGPVERLVGSVTSVGAAQTGAGSYGYDAVGNLLSRTVDGATTTMTYNAANQLTSLDGVTVAYDSDGNQTGAGTGDAVGYDDAGRAVSLDVGGSGPLPAVYRGDDQVERASLGGTTAITSLLGVTAETAGGQTTGYTRLPGGAVHAVRSPGGAVHYVLADRLGSTVAFGVTSTIVGAAAIISSGGLNPLSYAGLGYGLTLVGTAYSCW